MQRQLKVVRMMRLLFDGRGEFPPPPPTPSVHQRRKWQLYHEIPLRAHVGTAGEGWTEPRTWEKFHVSHKFDRLPRTESQNQFASPNSLAEQLRGSRHSVWWHTLRIAALQPEVGGS